MEIFLKDKSEKEDDEKEKKAKEKPTPKPAAVSVVKKDEKPEKEDKEGDEMNQNISKLISTGDVYRQQKPDNPGNVSLALANKGDYEEKTGIIMMTGAIRIRQANSPRPCTTISCAWSARTWSRNTRS